MLSRERRCHWLVKSRTAFYFFSYKKAFLGNYDFTRRLFGFTQSFVNSILIFCCNSKINYCCILVVNE